MLMEALVIAGSAGLLLTLLFGLKFTEDVWIFRGVLTREKKPKVKETIGDYSSKELIEREAKTRRDLLATPRRERSMSEAFNVVYKTEEGTKVAYPVPPFKSADETYIQEQLDYLETESTEKKTKPNDLGLDKVKKEELFS